MSQNMMDNLINKIKEKNSPIVMGIDPRYEMIPDIIKSKYPKDMAGFAESAVVFAKKLIDATYDIIPAIKPQLAYFEMMGPNGLDAFQEIVDYAKSKDLIVIADAKRGDIGTTSQGYANTFLGETSLDDYKEKIYDADFVTVNPYMGTDCVKPFIEDSKKYGKGVFVLVKTSNNPIKKCQNCGMYFIPNSRLDEIYCDYPKANGKTCREQGAVQAYNERLKQNKAFAEYRRLYQLKSMAVGRNKDNKQMKKDFDKWKKDAKDRVNKLKHGVLTENEVYEWLVNNK